MSYKISDPMWWHLPRGLPTGHRMVLLALAAKCPDPVTRRVSMPRADLMQMTGLSESRIRNVLADLAERHGIEIRAVIGKGSDGRPFYAARGAWATFVLPIFPPPDGCRCPDCR